MCLDACLDAIFGDLTRSDSEVILNTVIITALAMYKAVFRQT